MEGGERQGLPPIDNIPILMNLARKAGTKLFHKVEIVLTWQTESTGNSWRNTHNRKKIQQLLIPPKLAAELLPNCMG
jgi:hypothetical protein